MGFTIKKGVLRRVLRRGSEKAVSRRRLERPLEEYSPLGVRPTLELAYLELADLKGKGLRARNLYFSYFLPLSDQRPKPILYQAYPKDPAVLKIVRVVNLLRIVFLVRRGDLLSQRTLCRHHFPGNYRHFSSQRRVHGVVNLGGVVKTLRRSNSLFFRKMQSSSLFVGLIF